MLYDMIVMSDVVIVSCVFVCSWCGTLLMSSGDVCVLEMVAVCCCLRRRVLLCVFVVVFRE